MITSRITTPSGCALLDIAPGDEKDLAAHAPCLVARQVHNGRHELVELDPPDLRALHLREVVARLHGPRRDGVDADPVVAQLAGEGPAETRDRGLGGRMHGHLALWL